MSKQIKFYRTETLPESGEPGSLYFVYGQGGTQSQLYICLGSNLFESYTPDLYTIMNKLDNINEVVAKEATLNSAKEEILTAVENAAPEVDLSEVAKQGENTEATNTAILAEIKAINDLKNIYSVRFEQNQDGDNTYTMVLPLVAGIVGDTIVM